MASKPMLRSLKVLRENDWQCAVVERWKPVFDKKTRQLRPFGVRVDAFGFGDILAYSATRKQIALIQTTDASSFSKRRLKTLALPELYGWKAAGGLVFLHGWGKQGPRGKRKTWTLKEEVL